MMRSARRNRAGASAQEELRALDNARAALVPLEREIGELENS